MVTQFNQKDLVSFGNFLLSPKNKSLVSAKITSMVTHADIENWKESQSKVLKVRAKFTCNSVKSNEEYDNVTIGMSVVTYEGQGENGDFSKYTPMGDLSMQVDNGTLGRDFFREGQEYYLDFTKAKMK